MQDASNPSSQPRGSETIRGRIRRYSPFLVWLTCFYTVWGCLMATGDRWRLAVDHWPISAAMAFGSYFAGSIPMGGGTVGFPVLACRADLRIAIPTSVILMAGTSLTGLLTKRLTGEFETEVFANWLAAAPIVAIGAPLGAWVVAHVSRRLTLLLVSLLCVAQYGWTLSEEWRQLGTKGALLSLLAIGVLFVGFEALHRFGGFLAQRRRVLVRQANDAPSTSTSTSTSQATNRI